jgi:clorobiocin biosynthesis protein CloN5
MSAAGSQRWVEPLRAFLEERHLDGRAELAADTPLLEWGILDSLSLAELTTFIEERFGLRVPLEAIVPDNFRDLEAIAAMLGGLDAAKA